MRCTSTTPGNSKRSPPPKAGTARALPDSKGIDFCKLWDLPDQIHARTRGSDAQSGCGDRICTTGNAPEFTANASCDERVDSNKRHTAQTRMEAQLRRVQLRQLQPKSPAPSTANWPLLQETRQASCPIEFAEMTIANRPNTPALQHERDLETEYPNGALLG